MPLHDWNPVPAGIFHDFHQGWSVRIAAALNMGLLPSDTAALLERSGLPETASPGAPSDCRSDEEVYARLANRIVLRHHLGRMVAVIEILSPGNKGSRAALQDFVEKTIQFLREGIHVLVIDLFPPTPRDPQGIHKAIWDYIEEEPFAFPPGKDRLLVSYQTGDERAAYIEPVAVGDTLPEMPLFLTGEIYVRAPLETTYQATWDATPALVRQVVETGLLPAPEAD